jgi:hypothetical protein
LSPSSSLSRHPAWREFVGGSSNWSRGGAARGIEEPLDPSRSRGTGGDGIFPCAFPSPAAGGFPGKASGKRMARWIQETAAGGLMISDSKRQCAPAGCGSMAPWTDHQRTVGKGKGGQQATGT